MNSPARYRLYGQSLTSNVQLPQVPTCNDLGPVTVRYTQMPPGDRSADTATRTLIKRMELDIGGWLSLFAWQHGYVLQFEDRAEFLVSSDGTSVVCQPTEGAVQSWLDSVCCGLVMSFVLYLRGTANIHASGIRLPNGVLGLIGVPGTGKSTFAAALVRSGFHLLTDDVLPLVQRGEEFEAMPGFPVMGMSGATLAYLGIDPIDPGIAAHLAAGAKVRVPLNAIGGSFHPEPAPLRALYLLSRESDPSAKFSIDTLAPQHAMQALFEHTPCFELLKATSLKFHWDFVANVVSSVPVKVVSYPTGFDNLQKAVQAVLVEENAVPFAATAR